LIAPAPIVAYGGGVTSGYDAVILAGGRARRLGGLDKPGLDVGARTLVENVVAAVPGARRVVVVGPERGLRKVIGVREDPPGSGPVPALRAGPRRALERYAGRSPHGLRAPLAGVRVALPRRAWFDRDTMEDLKEARMNVLNEWTTLACQELGIDPARVDRDLILDLTKEVAHGVARPAAPLTAYLLGLAEGAGTAPEDAVARLTALANNWGQATRETLTDT